MQAPGFTNDRALMVVLLVAFGVTALLAAADLVTDFRQGTTLAHVLTEGAIAVVGLAGALVVGARLRATVRRAAAATAEASALAERLRDTAAEAVRWRNEARDLMEGLGRAIDEQLDRWELSPAEKEVALLLLKGLSHKEIADARDVTEATARQQARAVYRKAGLAGRHELSAFFLEDLVLPAAVRSPPG